MVRPGLPASSPVALPPPASWAPSVATERREACSAGPRSDPAARSRQAGCLQHSQGRVAPPGGSFLPPRDTPILRTPQDQGLAPAPQTAGVWTAALDEGAFLSLKPLVPLGKQVLVSPPFLFAGLRFFSFQQTLSFRAVLGSQQI